MAPYFHTTVFGQLVRFVSRGKVFRHPDEVNPSLWRKAVDQHALDISQAESTASLGQQSGKDDGSSTSKFENDPSSTESLQYGPAAPDRDLVEKTGGDHANILIVGWYAPDDPENPRNWSSSLKILVICQMCLLNFSVYIATSIFVPGETSFTNEFGVSDEVATLGLSMFTLGYGMGPMLWSPLSEIPKLGRTGIFFWTLLAFIIFQLPVGLAPNVACFLVFRWVTGFCGSPCLATGGGTINDIYTPAEAQYSMCIWAAAGTLAPVMGPLVGGFVAPVLGWRWTIWPFTCLCAAVLVFMFFFFPETSAANILYNRAKRLRQATGNERLRSQTEVDTAHHTAKDNLLLIGRAFSITFTQPIVFLMDLYAGLLYGILFTWFESFPIVFGGYYHFTSGEQGLVFVGILVFAMISLPCLLLWIKRSLVPAMLSDHFKPEVVLPPTIVGAFVLPACLFLFGWTSRPSVPWIVPVIGSGLFAIGIVTLFNSLYMYIGIVYAPYAASVFAGATLLRASFGASFPLFARALFDNLGIGGGSSLLGGIAILFIPIPFVFIHYGERIRKWSSLAT